MIDYEQDYTTFDEENWEEKVKAFFPKDANGQKRFLNARHYMDEYPTEMFKFYGKNETVLDEDIAGYDRRNRKQSTLPEIKIYFVENRVSGDDKQNKSSDTLEDSGLESMNSSGEDKTPKRPNSAEEGSKKKYSTKKLKFFDFD